MFNHLVGNEHVKQTLRHLIAKGRVPNSLLFAGDDGIGKRQFAIELAKAFVCMDPSGGEACDVCAACRRAFVFSFPKLCCVCPGASPHKLYFSAIKRAAIFCPSRPVSLPSRESEVRNKIVCLIESGDSCSLYCLATS